MMSTNAATNMTTTTTANTTIRRSSNNSSGSSSTTTTGNTGNTFDTLILPHRAALSAQARRLTGNQNDAEDLVQETLLRAYTRLDQVTNRETVGPWLHTILRNLFINEYHKKKRAPHSVELDKAEVSARNTFATSSSRSPESAVIGQMEHTALIGAVEKLPAPYRDILILADMEGLPYQEIAEKMQMPLGTVRSRLFRARHRVQRSLYSWRPN